MAFFADKEMISRLFPETSASEMKSEDSKPELEEENINEEIKLIPAKELLTYAIEERMKIVYEIDLEIAKKHVTQKINTNGLSGAAHYSWYCPKVIYNCRTLLFRRLINFVKPFEEAGYRVKIVDKGNGYWTEFYVTFNWGGNPDNDHYESRLFGETEVLYSTVRPLLPTAPESEIRHEKL